MNVDRSVEEYIKHKDEFVPVDVRSPGEYEESHIPHAVNIPLFTNEERAEVGTIYKEEGKKAAKWRAMEIVSPKLPKLLEMIRDIENNNMVPLLYCWRGGMRSQSMAHFAMLSGLHVNRLDGGYRAYREFIVQSIPTLIPEKAIVIYGLTGTGKTDILQNLKKRGYPVLDLEEYANHKGSVFGAVNGQTPHNQKTFDSLLYEDLVKINGSKYFFMEGESKRIGHAVQPPELHDKKLDGIHIHVTSSLEARVKRIYEQYVEQTDDFQNRVMDALSRILKRVKPQEIAMQMLEAVQQRDYEQLIRLLIIYYYDPRYDNKISESIHTDYVVDSTDVEDATDKIIKIFEEKIAIKLP